MSFSKKDMKVKKYFQYSKILQKIDTKLMYLLWQLMLGKNTCMVLVKVGQPMLVLVRALTL